MRLPLVSKILKDVSAVKKKEDRIKTLRSHHPNKVMLQLLKYTFDDKIVFALPDGAPPYKPCGVLDNEAGLYQEQRRLYLFIEGGHPDLSQLRRETLFIQVLESIPPEEAELLIAVKDKKLPYKNITKEIVQEAFPGLLS
jgi:hypothetical protein